MQRHVQTPVRRKTKVQHGGLPERRQPQQLRSRQTVEAILDAVVLLLGKRGAAAVTTNRVAEVAGVSIGSVYQYFPNKRAIFVALHDRHVERMGLLVENALVAQASDSLEDSLGKLVGALIDAHATDPELYELLLTQVPPGSDGARQFESRWRGALRLAISSHAGGALPMRDLDRTLFVVTHLLQALCHAAVLRRPARLSLAAAKEETLRALLAYLRS
jgi:AcrR family transcriptional regulator